jgi:hypothetical protein
MSIINMLQSHQRDQQDIEITDDDGGSRTTPASITLNQTGMGLLGNFS